MLRVFKNKYLCKEKTILLKEKLISHIIKEAYKKKQNEPRQHINIDQGSIKLITNCPLDSFTIILRLL